MLGGSTFLSCVGFSFVSLFQFFSEDAALSSVHRFSLSESWNFRSSLDPKIP